MSSNEPTGVFGLDFGTENLVHRIGLYASAILMAAIGVFPIYWIVQNALKTRNAILAGLSWLPRGDAFTLQNLQVVFTGEIAQYFINSIIVTVGTIVFVIIVSTISGYGLARFEFKHKINFARFLLFGYMFSPIVLGVPLFLIWRNLNLINTHVGLILALSAISMPFCVWLMWKYIQTIPESMEESAWVVGASRKRAFVDVVLPQCKPAIVATALFAFALAWTDFTFAMVLLPDSEMTTFAPGILRIVLGSYNVSWGQIMAASLLMTVPALVFAYSLQSYLLKGFEIRSL
ncbi:carbohydrate ABC transporter permease [Halorarius halobius]|uniref:carbohydrate ABC transporter permease n=1 Tax=Halorarius halobius TaxID=2962671 RepID=UPI0020CEB559|nr:carbohydrate ABC transporter permease [Halorarius halobius]